VPRSLRFFLIWLCCTTLTVTAVFVTVNFVVGSTSPMPPTARAMPTLFPVDSTSPTASPTPTPTPTPTGTSSSTRRPSPPATHSPRPSATHQAPPPSPSPTEHQSSGPSCSGGAGTHTIQSTGGQATIDFGSDAVCLVSAVPSPGFTVSTQQNAQDTLTIVFTSSSHRSQIVGTINPQPRATTTETG
jgi:hypothetical protein